MKTTERFSNRVENYVKYRPTYPIGVLERLCADGVLSENSIIADVGSGTGISSKVFLENGNVVFGVEPNPEMREAAEEFLQDEKLFHSITGSAEETTLKNNSVDLILAGQAFHWFDAEKARTEFKRILKPDGNVVLMWNDRRTESTPVRRSDGVRDEGGGFLQSYEDLLKLFGTDYGKVNHRNTGEKNFDSFWGKGNWKHFSVPNFQDFTYEGLKGRLFSSSYVPAEKHPDSPFMINVLKKIFMRYQESGLVRFEYDTIVYYGKLK